MWPWPSVQNHSRSKRRKTPKNQWCSVLISSGQTIAGSVGGRYCSRDGPALEIGLAAEFIDCRGTWNTRWAFDDTADSGGFNRTLYFHHSQTARQQGTVTLQDLVLMSGLSRYGALGHILGGEMEDIRRMVMYQLFSIEFNSSPQLVARVTKVSDHMQSSIGSPIPASKIWQ